MKGKILLLFAILLVPAVVSKQGCLPGCECGQTDTKRPGSSSQYRIISCDKFPSQPLPQGVSTFKAKQSPKLISRNSFELLNPTYITTLDLCESGIESLADKALEIFQRLAVLKLSLNKIKTLTSNAFTGCKQVESIYLDGNGLTSLGPNCFTNLPKLTNLYIQHNKIKAIPPLPSSLNYLDASYNLIGPEVNDYTFQEKVRYVDLCGNPITSVEASCFSKTALESLCIPGRLEPQGKEAGYTSSLNNITLIANPPGTSLTPYLVEQLTNLGELQHLTIISYNISSLEFLNSKILQTLALENVGVIGRSPKELVDALAKQVHLEKLSLAYSPQLADDLANNAIIWQHLTRLQNLDVRGCRLRSLYSIQGHGIPMYIDLSDNPLHCDCQLIGALGTDLLLCDEVGVAICATPDIYTGQSLESVHSDSCRIDQKFPSANKIEEGNVGLSNKPHYIEEETGFPNGNDGPPHDEISMESPKGREDVVQFGKINQNEGPNENHFKGDASPIDSRENPDLNEEHFRFPDSDGNKHPGEENNGSPESQGHHFTTNHPSTFKEFDDKYAEHSEGKDKKTLIGTILGAVVGIAVVAAVVFAVLFFYFRRRGHGNIEGAAHEEYGRKQTNTKDHSVK